jgi:hypothetical protein
MADGNEIDWLWLIGHRADVLPRDKVVQGFLRLSERGLSSGRYDRASLRRALSLVADGLAKAGYVPLELQPLHDFMRRLTAH